MREVLIKFEKLIDAWIRRIRIIKSSERKNVVRNAAEIL
jgi:hypothetical protein